MNQKIATTSGLLAVLLTLDIVTKQWALDTLSHHMQTSGFGGLVPFTLTFNRGVAFGFGVGDWRWFIIAGTVLVLCALSVLLYQARHDDTLRIVSLAAVMAGALGNLIDRVRWDRGVVDFIGPFDMGVALFPIFNVADMAITVGAVSLAFSLWLEERQEAAAAAAVEPAVEKAATTDLA